jgi:transaldolase
MLTNRPKTKLLVDGGDPEETLRIKNLIGFVDGQTTNPSLIAKNPDIQRRLASGQQLSEQEEKDAYKKIVQSISPLVGDAGVSVEVFADLDSRAEEMLAQGQEMFTWIPNAYQPVAEVFSGVGHESSIGISARKASERSGSVGDTFSCP